MAASFTRSPVTPLHSENNRKLSQLGPIARVNISSNGTCSKRRCSIALACVDNSNDENVKSREVQKILEDSPSEALSKGSHSLPSKEIPKYFLVIYLFVYLYFLFFMVLVFGSFCLVAGEPEERKVLKVEKL